MKKKNKPKTWKLALLGKKGMDVYQFYGTFEEALAELDEHECEVKFEVIGAVALVVKGGGK